MWAGNVPRRRPEAHATDSSRPQPGLDSCKQPWFQWLFMIFYFLNYFLKESTKKKKKKNPYLSLYHLIPYTISLCLPFSLSVTLGGEGFWKKKKKVLGFIHWFFYFVVIVSYFINPSFIYIDFFLLPKVI